MAVNKPLAAHKALALPAAQAEPADAPPPPTSRPDGHAKPPARAGSQDAGAIDTTESDVEKAAAAVPAVDAAPAVDAVPVADAPEASPIPTADARAEEMYTRYSPARKRFFCAILAVCSLLPPVGTTACLTALAEIAATFHTTGSVVNISNGLYTGAMSVAAFVWGVVGMLGGRRAVIVPSAVAFAAFSLGCALAPNLHALFVFRVLSGLTGTGLLVSGPAVVGDIYRPTERGTALAWILSGTLIGPALGPMIGGIIVTYAGWRDIYWFQTALAGLAVVLSVLFLPETAHTRRWDALPRAPRARALACLAAFSPLRMLALLRQPDFVLVALASSALTWNMYAFLAPIVYVINPRMHFTKPVQAGLFYLAPGCGYLTGTLFGGRNADRVVKAWIRKRGGVRRPQDRLRALVPWMGVGTPVCMLIYGWCLETNKGGIAVLVVVMYIQGFTQLMSFPAINAYCIDVLPGRGSEILGANFFVRYIFGAAGTMLAIPATSHIGVGWFTTISTVFIVLSVAGVLLVIYDVVPFCRKMYPEGDRVEASSE